MSTDCRREVAEPHWSVRRVLLVSLHLVLTGQSPVHDKSSLDPRSNAARTDQQLRPRYQCLIGLRARAAVGTHLPVCPQRANMEFVPALLVKVRRGEARESLLCLCHLHRRVMSIGGPVF